MIDLEPLKKCLRVSPTLYRNAYKLYRATPFGRARSAQIHKECVELLKVRSGSEVRLIREYLNDDWTVRHGPFAGMKYAAMSSGSLLSPKVIGSYESPIHSWIMDTIRHDYDTILNVGCGEGYYAVGFSLKSPSSRIHAYDIDAEARENAATLARLNNVEDRILIRSLCTKDALRREIANDTLIFCDIEGGELELFHPDLVPELRRADLIIELHDFCCPGTTEVLLRRFHPSHRIEVTYHCAKYANDFPVLERIPVKEQAFLLEEARPVTQGWIRLLANRPGALQPEPDRWWLLE
jgi:Ribosomal protein L11 methyltransferase (PrmA)